MASASKNARKAAASQKFSCSCGGEVVLKTLIDGGKIRNIAECSQCHRVERRPKNFH